MRLIPMNLKYYSEQKDAMARVFEDTNFLEVYDIILPLAAHYKRIMAIHQDQLKDCKSIADLGCGTGNLTIAYIRSGKKVTAIDASAKSLKILKGKIKKLPKHKKVKIIKGDVSHLKKTKSHKFHGVSSMIAAHLLEDFQGHIEESYRILKPGGEFVITARQAGGNQVEIANIVKNSLQKIGKFAKYKTEYLILKNRLLCTADDRSLSLLSTDDVRVIMHQVGFEKITQHKNLSRGVMYTFSAKSKK
jgi:ubiquinone/menaquinone biosynthesis C-methylase UbiE